MSLLKAALRLARHGFYVFPCVDGGKTPLFKGWQDWATRDEEKIRAKWTCGVLGTEFDWNVGIFLGKFDSGYLVGLDVDNKDGRDGDGDLLKLELEGKELPNTFEQLTPTGGRHLVYRVPSPVGNGRGSLPLGVDVRGSGGYIIGAGSKVAAGLYKANFLPPIDSPTWLVEALSATKEKSRRLGIPSGTTVDEQYAVRRAVAYLKQQPGAELGQRGSTAYKLAARLKDFGCSSLSAYECLIDWADQCDPPMPDEDLSIAVENAYRYGRDVQGAAAPEADFEPIEEDETPPPKEDSTMLAPVAKLNDEYAFIIAGNGHHILWETIDAKGRFELKHLNEASFHAKYRNQFVTKGDGKTEIISRMWMSSRERRNYDGFCFRPGLETPPGFYNLFHGFAVEPAKKEESHPSVDRFLEHALENVCQGDRALFHWLIGYFAHLIQRPWEKPLVALVFKGSKGVGKNALVDSVGYLLGQHYLLTADDRYLLGNFNGHLERLLLFTLDEAMWAGDKKAEGKLKNLITGTSHTIEHKGQEAFTVDNCTRIVLLGNEEWLVPASMDERRFAVFEVGEGRKQDRAYFEAMRKGLESGGYGVLLRYLLSYDLSSVDVNAAPVTAGLLEQKISSFDPLHQWWFECLRAGELVYGPESGVWPELIAKDSFRFALKRSMQDRQVRSRLPDERGVWKFLRMYVPGIQNLAKIKEGEGWKHAYKLPNLEHCRRGFEKRLGHEVDWTS